MKNNNNNNIENENKTKTIEFDLCCVLDLRPRIIYIIFAFVNFVFDSLFSLKFARCWRRCFVSDLIRVALFVVVVVVVVELLFEHQVQNG